MFIKLKYKVIVTELEEIKTIFKCSFFKGYCFDVVSADIASRRTR